MKLSRRKLSVLLRDIFVLYQKKRIPLYRILFWFCLSLFMIYLSVYSSVSDLFSPFSRILAKTIS